MLLAMMRIFLQDNCICIPVGRRYYRYIIRVVRQGRVTARGIQLSCRHYRTVMQNLLSYPFSTITLPCRLIMPCTLVRSTSDGKPVVQNTPRPLHDHGDLMYLPGDSDSRASTRSGLVTSSGRRLSMSSSCRIMIEERRWLSRRSVAIVSSEGRLMSAIPAELNCLRASSLQPHG